jgi:xanthine dehydrogenase YagR molybdenum-binding subunit
MPYQWPDKRQIIGTAVPRLDGAMKASGRAKYAFDRNLPGMLFGKILRSPHAHARVTALDLAPAEGMPGVKATHVIKGPGSELHFAGDEIAAVAAETEELARDALRAVRVTYEVLPHVASEAEGEKRAAGVDPDAAGDVEEGLRESDVTVEGLYGAPAITHMCLESHGLVAHWKSDNELVVYASTQAVTGVAGAMQGHFKRIPGLKVLCECPFMGGGFGSKFGPDVQGIVAAELALKARRPVKLMLERDEEHVAGGNRPSAYARVRAGATRDGKLKAFDALTWGTGGHSRGAGFPLPYIYAPASRRRRHADVATNAGEARAFRAPGHPQGSLIMEQVMDDLADKLGMDPLEFRLLNLPETNPTFRMLKPIYEREVKLGAERIGWKQNRRPRGEGGPGPVRRGLGMALSTWGGSAGNAEASCTIHPDGRVEVRCGTQDLGTGTTTLVPLVAAEILGIEVKDIDGRIGSSAYPPAGASGGSTTCGGVSLAVGVACLKALKLIFDRAAPELYAASPDALEADGGRVYVKADPSKGLSWRQACALLGQQPVTATANKDEGKGMSSQGVGGCQFADVTVDIETGEVRVHKIVAVADCGMVMNRLLCESQVYGGVVMGLCYGLFEDRRLDPKSGRQLNPDLEWYKLAGHSDVPEIEVHLLDYPERGVIGIGEPPIVPTAGAIANAVANAAGVRVGVVPLTPKRVLDALAAAGR